jgi:hypothetical protein
LGYACEEKIIMAHDRITAKIKQHRIDLPLDVDWPDGMMVNIEPVEDETRPTVWEVLKKYEGMATDLPPDLSTTYKAQKLANIMNRYDDDGDEIPPRHSKNGINGNLEPEDEEEMPTLAEIFKDWIGIANDLPSDLAENIDHYVHGLPKK